MRACVCRTTKSSSYELSVQQPLICVYNNLNISLKQSCYFLEACTETQVQTHQTNKQQMHHTSFSVEDRKVSVCVVSHLVPTCVTPPPPFHLSPLCCPSYISTLFIATLRISFLCVCVCARVCRCTGGRRQPDWQRWRRQRRGGRRLTRGRSFTCRGC